MKNLKDDKIQNEDEDERQRKSLAQRFQLQQAGLMIPMGDL